MDFLARREHSREELAAKLLDRFPGANRVLIETVLSRLADENLQSDRRFAEAYLRKRMERGYGWLHIGASLRAKGVAEDILRGLARPDEDWLALAAHQLASRLGADGRLVAGSREHQRLYRHLHSRGFPAEIAHKALQTHLRAAQL